MGAAYSFVSHWTVAATTERCWSELERTLRAGSGPGWWRGMRIAQSPERLAVGQTVVLDVRSPLGYRLRPRVTITEVVPGRMISVSSAGDLRGTGRLELADAGGGCDIAIRWDVATEKPWMNATAFLLRPVFAWAHAHVMAKGERGLRAAVDASGSEPRNAGNPDPGAGLGSRAG